MYVPKHFEESRLSVLQAFMREHPFVTLVTDGDNGIEVKGKWKSNRNQDHSDRSGVISAAAQSPDQAASAVAEMMAQAEDGGIS